MKLHVPLFLGIIVLLLLGSSFGEAPQAACQFRNYNLHINFCWITVSWTTSVSQNCQPSRVVIERKRSDQGEWEILDDDAEPPFEDTPPDFFHYDYDYRLTLLCNNYTGTPGGTPCYPATDVIELWNLSWNDPGGVQ